LMEIIKLNIQGLVLVIPKVFKDERGFFFESFNKKEFDHAL